MYSSSLLPMLLQWEDTDPRQRQSVKGKSIKPKQVFCAASTNCFKLYT
jgi:hypothetical protein